MITCPHGKQHEIADLKGFVDKSEPDLDKAITFDCGCSKRFWTLKRALKTKIFDEEHVERIRRTARELRAHKSSLTCG